MRNALLLLVITISFSAHAQINREIAALNKLFWHYHPNADAQYTVIKSGRLFTSYPGTDAMTGKAKKMVNVASLNSIKSVEAIKLLYEDPATKNKEEYLSLRISASWVEAEEAGEYADGDFSVSGKGFKLSKSETKGEWDVIVCSSEEKLDEAVFMDMAEALKKVAGLAHDSYSSLFTAAARIASYKEGVTSIEALHGMWEPVGMSPKETFKSILASKNIKWLANGDTKAVRAAIKEMMKEYVQFDSTSKKFVYESVEGDSYDVDALKERIIFNKGGERTASIKAWIWEPSKACGCGDGVYLIFRNYFIGLDVYFKLKR